MLDLTTERAAIEDGHSILDLGCGWGAFSWYAAERFPDSTVVGLSNSHSQRQYLENQALERGLANLRIVTADINDFEAGPQFDRIVSVEMMEHVRNYERLLRKVASWPHIYLSSIRVSLRGPGFERLDGSALFH